MCGRFSRYTPLENLAGRFQASVRDHLPPSYNIAPSQPVLALRRHEGARELVALRWGLVPGWSRGPDSRYSMINARAETLASKPAYRDAYRRRRCLILADGFYEWQRRDRGARQPFHLHLPDHQPFAFAGLWEHWEGDGQIIDSCTIVTTDANAVVAPIHDRMPVILEGGDAECWLAADAPDERQALLRPLPDQRLRAYPVSTHVNKPAHDDPDCLAPRP